MSSLTGANATFTLVIPGVFNTPVILQGFAVDDSFKSEAVPQTETRMGVDGNLSGGFIFQPYPTTIMIQPDRPSLAIFETWRASQQAAGDVFTANGSILLANIGQQYTLFKGFLTSAHPFPDVKKLLEPLPYVITWNSIVSSPTVVL